MRGDPRDDVPGRQIVVPEHPSQIRVSEIDLDRVRRSYLANAVAAVPQDTRLEPVDIEFLAAETQSTPSYVEEILDEMRRTAG